MNAKKSRVQKNTERFKISEECQESFSALKNEGKFEGTEKGRKVRGRR